MVGVADHHVNQEPAKPAPLPVDDAGTAWRAHAEALADWTWDRLVNRTDVWGAYGTAGTWTAPAKAERGHVLLMPGTLARHFRGQRRTHIIGLHSTSPENTSRWGGIDIDKHGEGGDAAGNLRAALAWYAKLRTLGFWLLLTDSNERGGFHLLAVFCRPVPTARVFGFLKWLVSDWDKHKMTAPPETFPKQANIPAGRFGNWLRLPGRHHSRDHWSRVWDGQCWLDGAEAVAFILTRRGDAPALIPADLPSAAETKPTPRRPPIAVPFEDACPLVRRIRAYLARLPHRAEGEHRDDIAFNAACFLVRDLHLPDDVALTCLSEWDAGNRPPKGEARLREIIANAHLYGTRPYGSGLDAVPRPVPHKRHKISRSTFTMGRRI
jgi:hypothetical protein